MKRLFDLCVSVSALIALFPIFIIIAILVRVKLGSPVLFSQQRPGLNSIPFKMLKFRSMTNERDETGQLLDDEKRLNGFGRLLRASSLDELPGLFNVVKGDMSLVGPRPLLMEYLPLYSEEQAKRHLVRPGITGWAQVNGRNTITWEEKFKLDVWYVNNKSTLLDVKILLLTVKKVFVKEGITADGEATMPKFSGTGK